MTTMTRDPNPLSQAWVVDVLKQEQLELADAKRVRQYGRRKFTKDIRLILWGLRIYVVLMMLVIFVQLWLGAHQ